MENQAFIDGQNLYFGTVKSSAPWQIDLKRFRVYLAEKYGIGKAYYFLGYNDPARNNLYLTIQEKKRKRRYGYRLYGNEKAI